MGRNAAILIALTGCNQIYGLHEVTQSPPIDGQQFDAREDLSCPTPGTVPTFTGITTQIIAMGDCIAFSTSDLAANLAVTVCSSGRPRYYQSTITAPDVQTAIDVVSNQAGASPSSEKLSPEGELWINQTDSVGYNAISVFTGGNPTWTWSYDAYAMPDADKYAALSTPMRAGPGRTVLYFVNNMVHELVDTGTWTEVRSYTAISFNVMTINSAPNLSPDGLRIVFGGMTYPELPLGSRPAVFYADRTALDQPFGLATELTGLPQGASDPFMSENCGRLYYSGLGAVSVVGEK